MRGHFGVLQLANIAEMDCLPVFMWFLRECAVILGYCSWRTLQRWTACLFLCDFCANARSFWGFAAGEHCRDGLPACFYVIFARMRGHFGVLQLANIAELTACLFLCDFCANARSFWGVAAGEHCRDGLPACYVFLRECAVILGCCSHGLPAFCFYNLAGVSTATFNDFFWQVHSQHTDLVIS